MRCKPKTRREKAGGRAPRTRATAGFQVTPLHGDTSRIQMRCACGGSCASCAGASLPSGGKPLTEADRAFFEPRFGRDLGGVRIHDDRETAGVAAALGAHAFTLGGRIGFAAGQYSPGTTAGRHLIAHELVHVAQQTDGAHSTPRAARAPRVRAAMPPGTIAGDWKITKSRRRQRMPDPLKTGGDTDETILLRAFREICPLATLSGGVISIASGPAPANRANGCRCLRDIEAGLPGLKSSRPTGEVQVEPQGWSLTQPGADPVLVSVRHPDDPFAWGYWTNVTAAEPYERQHVKPFFQTLAHEVCGHVWTFVQTGGRHSGGRGRNPRDHDPAIERENLIAEEHGVTPEEQRGFQHEQGDRPATTHAGESFLAARVTGFLHGSTGLTPTNASEVADSAKATSDQFPVFIELKGFAHANEGGAVRGSMRAFQVRLEMARKGISTRFQTRAGNTANRFILLPAEVSPGTSRFLTSSAGRRVEVRMFHNPRSKVSDLLPAKVYFDFGAKKPNATGTAMLDRVADFLKANSSRTVELIGRTDEVGSAASNLRLGRKRARSVRKELRQRGVPRSQIRRIASEGESRSVAKSAATHWQDRHVEIRL